MPVLLLSKQQPFMDVVAEALSASGIGWGASWQGTDAGSPDVIIEDCASYLEAIELEKASDISAPVVAVVPAGDVGSAVRAMQAGAWMCVENTAADALLLCVQLRDRVPRVESVEQRQAQSGKDVPFVTSVQPEHRLGDVLRYLSGIGAAILVTEDWTVCEVSDAWCQLFGNQARDMLGTDLRAWMNDETRVRICGASGHLATSGEHWKAEFIRRDGDCFCTDLSIRALSTGDEPRLLILAQSAVVQSQAEDDDLPRLEVETMIAELGRDLVHGNSDLQESIRRTGDFMQRVMQGTSVEMIGSCSQELTRGELESFCAGSSSTKARVCRLATDIGLPASDSYASPEVSPYLCVPVVDEDVVTGAYVISGAQHSSSLYHVMACQRLARFCVFAAGWSRTRELAANERMRSRAYFDIAAVVMVVLDSAGRIQALNHYAERLLGVEEEQVLGVDWVESFVPQEQQQDVRSTIDVVGRGQGSSQDIHRSNEILAGDGAIRTIAWFNAPLYLDDGSLCYVVCSGTDITERQAAEHALMASEAKFRSLFEQSHDGLVMMDAEQTIEMVNDSFLRMVSCDQMDAVGHVLTDWISDAGGQDHARAVSQLLSGAGRIEPYEAELIAKNGTLVPVSVTLWQESDEKGLPVRFVADIRDMTIWHRLARRLRESSRMEATGRLAGGIAHDYNNLLMVITNSADFILDEVPPDSPAASDAREIQKASEQAAELTRQLLAFGRKQVLRMVPLDLNKVAQNVLPMLQRTMGREIPVRVNLDEQPVRVFADRGQLEEILIHLALNAREAMPRGGSLQITTGLRDIGKDSPLCVQGVCPGSYACLAVEDSGIGMTDETLAHIFEPFFTTKELGAGLGLSTIYGIVTQMHGAIGVKSFPEMGAVFTIYLPVLRAEQRSDGSSDMAARSRRRVILLVEDNSAVRGLAGRMLRESGFLVVEKRSAIEALVLVQKALIDIDLVLSDVSMPGMEGAEFARELALAMPGVPLLFMSGRTAASLTDDGIDLVQHGLIQKPFTRSQILERVEHALSGAPAG